MHRSGRRIRPYALGALHAPVDRPRAVLDHGLRSSRQRVEQLLKHLEVGRGAVEIGRSRRRYHTRPRSTSAVLLDDGSRRRSTVVATGGSAGLDASTPYTAELCGGACSLFSHTACANRSTVAAAEYCCAHSTSGCDDICHRSTNGGEFTGVAGQRR